MKQKVICQDCGVDTGLEAEWDKEGKPLDFGCLTQACDACESIRIGLGLCYMCKTELTPENSIKDDIVCSKCIEKWNALPDMEIPCPACGTSLEQDHENMFELWCPQCMDVMFRFVSENKEKP